MRLEQRKSPRLETRVGNKGLISLRGICTGWWARIWWAEMVVCTKWWAGMVG